MEQTARAMAYSQGKFLALTAFSKHSRNKKLSSQEGKFLDDFGPTDWRTKGKLSGEEIMHTAAKYVDSVQQTYDVRDLPKFAATGTFAPFYQLARWSIGKAHNFLRFAVEPALKGNFIPLVNQTLWVGLVGGATLKALNEFLNPYADKAPTMKEIQATKDLGGDWKQALAYKMASMAQLAAYGGELANLAKMAADASRGNNVYFYDALVLGAAQNAKDNLIPFAQAVTEGDAEQAIDYFDRLLEQQIQTYRVATRLLSDEKQDDAAQADKHRDFRVYRQNMGLKVPSAQDFKSDPRTYHQSKFRKLNMETVDNEPIPQVLGNAIAEILESGMPPAEMKRAIQSLKSGSQRFFPEDRSEAGPYMDYLERTEPGKGTNRYVQQKEETRLRSALNRLVP